MTPERTIPAQSESAVEKPMRVALVSFDFGEYCIRLASELARDAEVMLLLPEREADGHLEALDPSVHFRPFSKPRLRQPLRQAQVIFALLRAINRFAPDVIHLQQGHLWFNLALPLLRRYPLVVTAHDPHHHLGDRGAHNTPQPVTDFGFHRAARIILHGHELKQSLAARCGIPDRVVDVIPHIALGDESAQENTVESPGLVLFFGRIWAYKGLEYLIRAEPMIAEAVPNVRFVIAGEGEDFSRYRRMMVHAERFVVYNEFVSDERRADLFQRASLVVLPYVEASQSGVIPLAYRFGKPVVATTVGGLPEMVDDGETGFLVPPRDEQALAAAVVRLLQDEPLRRRFAENGRRKLEAECAPAIVAQKTLTVYRRAIDSALSGHNHGFMSEEWTSISAQR